MSERPEIPASISHREYFEFLFKERVNKSPLPKIDTLNAIIQFRITDDDEGLWNVVVENGLVKEVTKRTIDNPTCTFCLDSKTFISIVKREITPQQAFFGGRADIKGNILLALKMNILVEYM
ncbi:MAG: SCP2 sterol-binding domain-containing protein [Candidatus Kuenenia sp.]|nr:SCP2 sterol-binding domain-containing protein [Candidatus Kuenenia hertensis]